MNHETQRLLSAAGRGARVQGQQRTLSREDGAIRCRSEWIDVWGVLMNSGLQRIHPEDVHLQYGPVSAELRRRADDDDHMRLLTPHAWMADTWVRYCAGTGAITFGKRGNYLWLCAFAAELAADEGM